MLRRIGFEYDVGNSLQTLCNEFMDREDRARSEFDDCLCLIMCVEDSATPATVDVPN